MTSMGGLPYSQEMRDIIKRMVVEVVEKERPRYRYATVIKIDRTARKCSVVFNGETGAVQVNMGSIQPSATNQIVRVEGIGVDKYITDVIGDAFYGIRTGRVQALYTSGKPYVTWTGDTTLSGPYEVFSAYSPSQYDLVQGIFIPGRGYVLYPIQDFQTNMPYAKWYPLTLQNNWVEYDGIYGTPSFTKSASGIVKVQGLIKSGTNAGNEIIGQLPVGFRPSRKMIFPAQSAATTQGSVDVWEDGTIRTRYCHAGFTSLDNISFPALDVMPASAINPVTFQNGWVNYMTQYPTDPYTWGTVGYWKDADNCAWETGLGWKGTVPANDTKIYDLPSSYLVSRYMHRRSTAGNNQSNWLYKNSGSSAGTSYGAASGVTAGYQSFDGVPYFPDSSGMVWYDLPFQNGWVNYDTSFYFPAQYTKTKSGHVHLRGLIKSGATGIIGVLPAGFRPARRLLFGTVSNAAAARVDIDYDGLVIADQSFNNAWGSLDSINFMAQK